MVAVDDAAAVPSRLEARAPLVAALVTVVLWASAFVGIRTAGQELSPGALALGRLVVGATTLAILLRLRGEHLPSHATLRPALPALLTCGLLWFGAYNVALNAAERRVDAGTAAMLVNVGPVLVAIFAGVLLREGFPRMLVAGCAIAFSGVVVIGLATSSGRTSTAGVALCLLAAAAYASGVVAQKPLLRRLSPLQTTLLCCIVATLACLPFAPTLAHDLAGRRRGVDRMARLPRRSSHRSRVHDLGVRARAYERRPTRGDDLSRSASLHPARLDGARRDAARARASGRGAVPARRRRLASPLRASDGSTELVRVAQCEGRRTDDENRRAADRENIGEVERDLAEHERVRYAAPPGNGGDEVAEGARPRDATRQRER